MTTIHAAAAAAVGALPVPLLDRYAQRLVRGSAFRRVCREHAVRLEPEARKILGRSKSSAGFLMRFVAPLRWADRVDDAMRLMTDAALLDRYLRIGPERGWRRERSPLGSREAARIVAASQRARQRGTAKAIRRAPAGTWGTLRTAGRSVVRLDTEDRPPLERLVDTLLDALSDVPDEVLEAMAEPFDRALEESLNTESTE